VQERQRRQAVHHHELQQEHRDRRPQLGAQRQQAAGKDRTAGSVGDEIEHRA